ncbi:MAG TPA: RagB/SusD family nutrient uptake outer membrane protein [Gemmatimonadaceae bacterium]|nr:RagB/SusD family nutrient uptake outer membrane protein [Gemmatimonadaceae bacterium]
MLTQPLRPRARRAITLLGCLSALGLGACDNFLAPKPTDVLAPENFYASAADAVSAVNAVYSQTQWVYFFYWYQSDVASDDIFATSNFGADGHQLASYTFDPTLWSIDNVWSNAYITINRANIVLDRVPPIVMDPVQRARVLGEAHYLRALMNFELVRLFGDVPLIEHEAKSVADAQVPRTPAAQVYALIVSDLQTAITQLPPSYSGTDLGRATSGAAQALLAKVYLNQRDYTNAAKYAGQVMSSGRYSLNARWLDNFKISTEFVNPESIFEINYGAPEQTAGVVGSVQALFSLPSGFPGGDAYGLMQVNPQLIALYAANDQRGNGATYMTSPYTDALGRTATWGVPNGAAFHKWLDETDSKNMTARSWQQEPNNWIIQRYADVLLIYAEAVNAGGAATAGSAEAALNLVRARAGIPTVSGLSATALSDSIRVERRREFAFEGQRWFDLSRWGVLDAVVRAKTTQMQTLFPGETSVHGAPSNLYPIPSGQINSNPQLTQNTGW